MNPLRQLLEFGQSYWLDNLTREMMRTSELARRVTEQGLRGVTSNPAIFHKASRQRCSTSSWPDLVRPVSRRARMGGAA